MLACRAPRSDVTCASSAQKVFTHCRPAEQLTCPGRSSRNRRRNTRISQCDQSPDLGIDSHRASIVFLQYVNSTLLPGCYCPEGTALYNDRCIYKTDCPCSNHKDERFPQDPQRLWTDSCSKRYRRASFLLLVTNCSLVRLLFKLAIVQTIVCSHRTLVLKVRPLGAKVPIPFALFLFLLRSRGLLWLHFLFCVSQISPLLQRCHNYSPSLRARRFSSAASLSVE